MLNFKPILFIIGTMLSVLAIAMLVPAAFDIVANDNNWNCFFISAFLTAFLGIGLVLTNQNQKFSIGIKQAFFLTTASWVIISAFGALPFYLSDLKIGYINAFFESVSALTTTGSTIFSGLDNLPPGILLWRSILSWVGGLGAIIMAITILPSLNIGGMQIFKTDVLEKSETILSRTAQISIAVASVYLLISTLCACAYWYLGMDKFDAINHAMTTISTSGFSTHDKSLGFFNNANLEYTASFFMVISALPFILYINTLRGDAGALWKDSQVKWFISILLISIIAVIVWLITRLNFPIETAIRTGIFTITSLLSSTGFFTYDYSIWGGFAVTLILMLSVVGGCSGSASGGIKIFRYQILYKATMAQITYIVQPNAILRPRVNNTVISDDIAGSVISFIIIFAFFFLSTALILSLCGLDYISSLSASAASLANLGTGVGSVVGPYGNYSTLPDLAKLVLSAAMILGRVEIFAAIVLFFPYFWQD